jgi:hypothetical protein
LKKYPLFLLILAVLAGYGGYHWLSTRTPEVWKHIPASASVILSSDKLQESPSPTLDSLAGIYRELPIVSLATGSLSLIKWFNQDPDQVTRFLDKKTITYAFHPLAGDRLGIVLYLPVKGDLEKKWLENPKAGSLRVSTHNFQGHPVTDISNERSEPLFSYILQNDYLMISQYGELIEDIIRNAKSKASAAKEADQFHPLPEGTHELSIYAKGNAWRELILSNQKQANVAAFLDVLPENFGLHLETQGSADGLLFHSEDNRTRQGIYQTLLAGQEGTRFENSGHISQQTTHLIRLGVSNGEKFKPAFRKWLSTRRSSHPAVATFEKALGKERDAFYHQIGPEIILCVNESGGGLSDNKVMLIRYDDYEKGRSAMSQFLKNSGSPSDSPLLFQGYEIFPVMIDNLMEGLFGSVFKGFSSSYVTFLEPYLVVGNNAQATKNYLIDYENQLTWSHSPEMDSLAIYHQNDGQLTLITNMSKVRAQNETSRAGLKSSLDRITTTVLTYQEDGNDANLALQINYGAMGGTSSVTKLTAEVEWNGPFPVVFSAMLNPLDESSEILLTNPNHQLIEINTTTGIPKVLAQLDGPMMGRAYKTDFLNIGRPQRIVCTSAFLYVIDEDDSGLLTILSDQAPVPIQGIDRTNDSRESSARFVLRGSDHNLYVWERVHKRPYKLNNGVSLENVLAPVVSTSLGHSNQHLLTQANGKIFLVNEKGTLMPGFPADMLASIGGAFATSQNRQSGQLEIQGVSRQGEFLKISPDGKVLVRRQLLLPEAGSNCKTLFDENNLDWLLLRQTTGKAAVLSKEGNEIFEIVSLKPNFSLKYHYFGSDNRFISVVSGGMLSIFDFKGNRIGDTPIPCQGALGITYQSAKRELNVFSQVERKIQIWAIKL